MNDALNPSPDDSDTEAIMIVDGEVVTLTKLQVNEYVLHHFTVLLKNIE